MIIYPAIDIIDGKCVRLSRGDYSNKTIYSDNLEEIARDWIVKGTNQLHLVDLDGAKAGLPTNKNKIMNIRDMFPEIFIQVGGGIRDNQSIEYYLENGINRVILGTKILKDKDFIFSIDASLRKKIAIDIAIKDGQLAGDGWENTQNEEISEYIKFLEGNGIELFIITDIKKDGMMQGIDYASIIDVLSHVNTKAIISGGVTTIDDVRAICKMDRTKVDGMIIGKALYEKSINLDEAINECS